MVMDQTGELSGAGEGTGKPVASTNGAPPPEQPASDANGGDKIAEEVAAAEGKAATAAKAAAETAQKKADAEQPKTSAEQPKKPAAASDTPPGPPAWEYDPADIINHNTFTVGQRSPLGPTIDRILGRSRNYLVWTSEGRIAFHFNPPLPQHMRPALGEFRRLATAANIVLAKEHKAAAHELLAAGLNYAFSTPAGEDAAAGLAPAQSFIDTRGRERARMNFLFFTIAASIVVFFILYAVKYWVTAVPAYQKEIAFGGMAGLIGAAISLAQRGEDLRIDPFSAPAHKAFDGILRALLGMIFGMIVVVAARSNVAFGIGMRSPYTMFILALVGGFSERLIPSVLNRLSQEQSDSKATDHPKSPPVGSTPGDANPKTPS